MNRQDILQMGRQAGSFIELAQEKDLLWLERFAALVASAEREACANSMVKIVMIPTYTHGALVKLSDVVNAIRARGQA